MSSSPRPAPRAFGHVETWVFDLDNTLYPHHLNLWQQVDERIRDYIARFLKITHEEAFRLQKDYYKRYGTSMRGLMTVHGMKPDDFLDFVHQIDHSPLTPNAALGAAIESLPGRKLILTNGTRRHADAVLARLELDPKPSPQTYDRFLKAHAVDAGKAAMFEDLARNLAVPHALGMTTVLVVPEHTREVFREGWEIEGRDALHVDHVTDDLVGFLERIKAPRSKPASAGATGRPCLTRCALFPTNRTSFKAFSPGSPHVADRACQDHRRRLRAARCDRPVDQRPGAGGGRGHARPARPWRCPRR
jgi:putative hydrolase of the HAD superfamily